MGRRKRQEEEEEAEGGGRGRGRRKRQEEEQGKGRDLDVSGVLEVQRVSREGDSLEATKVPESLGELKKLVALREVEEKSEGGGRREREPAGRTRRGREGKEFDREGDNEREEGEEPGRRDW
eukprot:719442-Hanusia_phi.AAC.1